MKKFLILILFINLSLPCYAGLKDITNGIKNVFYVPTAEELQFQKEQKIKEEIFKELDEYYNSLEKREINISGKNLRDILLQDDEKVETLYQKFNNNRNDMQSNKNLYDITSSYKEQYEEIYNKYVGKEIFEKAAKNYYSKSCIYNSDYKRLAQDFETEYSETYHEAYYNINKLITSYINKYKKISNEVYKYSYNYEKNKLQNFYKQRYGNIKYDGTMNILLAPSTSPKTNCYYITDAYTRLRVIQKVKNGILVANTNESVYGYQSHFKRAFVETNKPYVDNQIIFGKFLYIGNYSYINALGSSTTVWKFKELNEPTEKFYFYFN